MLGGARSAPYFATRADGTGGRGGIGGTGAFGARVARGARVICGVKLAGGRSKAMGGGAI